METSTSYTLHKLVFALDRAADALLREKFNISHSRALVLVMLHDQPGITQHELALALGRTDPAVSTLLAELGKDGYVTTRVSPLHKRKNIVELTPKGTELAAQAQAYLNEKFDSLLAAAKVDGEAYNRLNTQLYEALTKKED